MIIRNKKGTTDIILGKKIKSFAESPLLAAFLAAVYGPGGSYLSNEIFYRIARRRDQLSSGVKTGHFHIPNPTHAGKSKAEILTIVSNAISRALQGL